MAHKKLLQYGIFIGLIMAVMIEHLIQDWYGQARYIELARTHWVPEHTSVPIESSGLVIALIWFVRSWILARRKDQSFAAFARALQVGEYRMVDGSLKIVVSLVDGETTAKVTGA